jgi:IrrE N-terminal-like domain
VKTNGRQSLYEQLRRERQELSERDAIVLLCERLLSEAEAEPPIPVERLASLRGIVEIEARDQPWAGTLKPRGKNFVVSVRASDGYERQRFTVCHESSHTFFPGFADQPQFRCNGDRTRLEQQCDAAAIELLLPRRFFLGDLATASFDLDTVEELAGEYQASIEATALRVADLWPEPSLLLVLRERHKPRERGHEEQCEPKLRVDYSFRSGEWPFFLQHKSAEPDSPVGRAFSGELVSETGSLSELAAEDPGPVEIHARRYGNNGRVLALVRRAPTTAARR